jgi:hypothetical protein
MRIKLPVKLRDEKNTVRLMKGLSLLRTLDALRWMHDRD